MNPLKSHFSQRHLAQPKRYPLKGYSQLSIQNKKHRQLIKKIAEPFICYKSQQSHQTEINIAGYKTSGVYVNSNQASNLLQQEYTITKESIEKYIFTFCFEVGCDLPSEEETKLIYSLLLAHSKASTQVNDFIIIDEKKGGGETDNSNNNTMKMSTLMKKKNQQTVRKPSFYLLIKLCLEIYIKAKQSNIGGILQRLIIGIRKQIQAEDQNNQNLSFSKVGQNA